MTCGIYEIVCIETGKIYIGSSKEIQIRWKHHKTLLNNHYHVNRYLQRAWDKYGEDNFEFQILEECQEHILLKREQYYLDLFKSYESEIGYNLSKYADGVDNSQKYTVLSPDGIEYDVVNLKKFSLERGLGKCQLYRVANGNANQHLGWKAKKFDQTWEEWESSKKRQKKSGSGWNGRWKLIYNDGTEEIVPTLSSLCERGWSTGGLYHVMNGKQKIAYGIIKIEKIL